MIIKLYHFVGLRGLCGVKGRLREVYRFVSCYEVFAAYG